ncbi:MAG: PAS domain-containing sensor histidine kinase [bacterium]|nr:PAS domain-containing sensor histidine kinase [bacterium]
MARFFYNLTRVVRRARWLSYLLGAVAVGLGGATYYAMSQQHSPLASDSSYIVFLLNADLAVLLLLGLVVFRRLVHLYLERRRGRAGSRLHSRLVLFFSLFTLIPAVTMAIFSALFFNAGVQSWFDEKVQTALNESSAVAEAYLEEHKKVIRANVADMARDLSEQLPILMDNEEFFHEVVERQAGLRGLSEAIVFDQSPKVWARSQLTFALEFARITEDDLIRAQSGIVIYMDEAKDRVRALVSVRPSMGLYLMVGRLVDPQVLERIAQTEAAVGAYHDLGAQLGDLEIRFFLIFVIVSLLLLLVAVWFGLVYANQLVKPVSRLIEATQKVRKGDLTTYVKASSRDDFGVLGEAFNRMTEQLRHQRNDLIHANQRLDQRRQFIEAVLSGVSAGVIGLDLQGKINVANRFASDLLGVDLSEVMGRRLGVVVPEMETLLSEVVTMAQVTNTEVGLVPRDDSPAVHSEIVLKRQAQSITLSVRITREKSGGDFVVTFNDVTTLLRAQRQAAWADVARRVAHEIKNPLTPIQLASERLRRRYLPQVKDDPETFERCIDTITRQVKHLGEMVSEFSSFARMPSPSMRTVMLTRLCQQVVTLQAQALPEARFDLKVPDSLKVRCDEGQIEQVFTNLIANAVDACQGAGVTPHVLVHIQKTPGKGLLVVVQDNGPGFPKENREKLLDPYVTYKDSGTGLGLAIVKKIVEDHGGVMHLEDSPTGGARVVFVLPEMLIVENSSSAEEGDKKIHAL